MARTKPPAHADTPMELSKAYSGSSQRIPEVARRRKSLPPQKTRRNFCSLRSILCPYLNTGFHSMQRRGGRHSDTSIIKFLISRVETYLNANSQVNKKFPNWSRNLYINWSRNPNVPSCPVKTHINFGSLRSILRPSSNTEFNSIDSCGGIFAPTACVVKHTSILVVSEACYVHFWTQN